MKKIEEWTLIETVVDWQAFALDKIFLRNVVPIEYPFAIHLIPVNPQKPARPGGLIMPTGYAMSVMKISTMRKLIDVTIGVEIADQFRIIGNAVRNETALDLFAKKVTDAYNEIDRIVHQEAATEEPDAENRLN